jgi:hypothetical protein
MRTNNRDAYITAMKVWVVTDEEDAQYLVVARTAQTAEELAAVLASAPIRSVEKAEWTGRGEVVWPMDHIVGFWSPPDSVWAGYGIIPSEDWKVCPECLRVLDEYDFEDEEGPCTECQKEKP